MTKLELLKNVKILLRTEQYMTVKGRDIKCCLASQRRAINKIIEGLSFPKLTDKEFEAVLPEADYHTVKEIFGDLTF